MQRNSTPARTFDILPEVLDGAHGEPGGLVEGLVAVHLLVLLGKGGAAGDGQHALVGQRGHLGRLVRAHVDVRRVALTGACVGRKKKMGEKIR